MSRVIVHIDADAFFASVEQAADPRLRGKAIAVGGERRGIIASASYEARKFGIYTPMPTVRARKLCPKLIVLPGDFERYEQFSNWMFGYAYDFTPDVEQTSIDEGYFDITANHNKPPVEIAQTIRRAIQQSLKISVSEGIGANKLVSQIASKLNKPAAFHHVPPGNEIPFLYPLPNRWLPGVGPKMSARLDSAGLAQIRHVAAMPIDMLELLIGNQARQIRQFAHGVDERPLVPAKVAQKSFSEQQTFEQDLTDEGYLEAVLRRMADALFAKVREEGRSIRTLTVKVRYNDMVEDQCSESLTEPTDLETDVYTQLGLMLKAAWKRRVSLRLVSLKLSNVYDGVFRSELPLEVNARKQEASERLARVVDDLRRKHGNGVVLRGHDFRLRDAPQEAGAPVPAKPVRVRYIVRSVPTKSSYVPLRAHSYYSFLDSTLSPDAIVNLAVKHECPAVALTDTGNLHGAADFCQAAQKAGIRPILGAELTFEGKPLLLYVESAVGYANLCRLLSRHSTQPEAEEGSVAAQQRRAYGQAEFQDLTNGLIAVGHDTRLATLFPDRFYSVASKEHGGAPAVACPAVHHATPEDRFRYDIVQSIRTRTLLRQSHAEKRLDGRWHFRTAAEMHTGCRDHPEWLAHGREIAERCRFQFPFGKPQFPAFIPPDGSTAREFLRRLVYEGLHRCYHGRRIVADNGAVVPFEQVQAQLETELAIIAEVGYEDLFLITWDLLQTCRQRGIEWITRGSAADSLVCYCLGISDVCPIRFGLYFRRFLNRERMALHKLPDLDVDFPHDRKDDVVNLLFAKHGPEHCAVVGGFSTFQARSAVGDVAKVLGASEHQIRRFTEHFPWSFGGGWVPEDEIRPCGNQLIEKLKASPECRDLPIEDEPFRTAVDMAAFLDGFPRHPKMHPCGVVLSRQSMHELTPTFISNKGWPTTHLDMDAVEVVGLVKMDVLAQGGLAVMRDAKQALAERGISVDLASLEPWEDPEVWEMIASGGARAVHHIESPAMVGLCRQTNVREIDGLVAIVSVIRPGAANENKKLRFTRRYQKMEPPEYAHPCLEPCLRSTFGLVVYEEHILQICEAFAGMSPGRADVLRRALVKQKRDAIAAFATDFATAAQQRGHDDAKIKEVWELVTGFSGYAFCKAHSTAYGVEAYQAAWLKRYHPAEFMAAVLTNGKGFYQPLVYALECHRLGIGFLPPGVNQPGPAFVVEDGRIRVPLVRAKGLTQRTTDRLLAEHQRDRFASLADFYRRVAPQPEEMEAMIRVGGFDEFGQSRTAQFWDAQQVQRAFGQATNGQGWLLPTPSWERMPAVPLVEPTRQQRLQWETEYFDFAVSGHPLELFPNIAWDTYCPVTKLGEHIGEEVVTCGLVVEQRTHHQITGEPMKFLTLADWTGLVETELFADTYRSYGLATVRYPVLEVVATVEPFENGRGFSLRVLRAGKPRTGGRIFQA
jgi:DNA-directed DNA polymerase III PolC